MKAAKASILILITILMGGVLSASASEHAASTQISVRPPANFKIIAERHTYLECEGRKCFDCWSESSGATYVRIKTTYYLIATGSGTISCTPRQERKTIKTCKTRETPSGPQEECEYKDEVWTINRSRNFAPGEEMAHWDRPGGSEMACSEDVASRYGLSSYRRSAVVQEHTPLSDQEKQRIAKELQKELSYTYQGCTGVPSTAVENLQF